MSQENVSGFTRPTQVELQDSCVSTVLGSWLPAVPRTAGGERRAPQGDTELSAGGAIRVGRGMGKEVGAGEETVNRKCTWNVPVKQVEAVLPPPDFCILRPPSDAENLLVSARQNGLLFLLEKALFRGTLGVPKLLGGNNDTKAPRL